MPIARAYMMIRRPPQEVLEAFLEPATLKRFWLADASAKLVEGGSATWTFMVPGAVAETRLAAYEPGRRIVLEWPENEVAEITTTARPNGSTRIDVTTPVEGKTSEEAMARAIDATSGYTIVLCNLKTLLESGKSARLVEDQAQLIAEEGKPAA
jgi:uncharacterized protein YndB with AHSA1/START domain